MYLYIKDWEEYKRSNTKLVIITEWVEELYFETDLDFQKYLIEKEFQDTMKLITSNYSNEEREGWNSQLEWAKLVLAW